MTTIQLAGLTVHQSDSQASQAPRALVILLHGYGAPGTDLTSLAGEIAAPEGTLFLFPEAPIDLSGDGDSRAWWPIDIMRVQFAGMANRLDDFVAALTDGIGDTAERVSTLISEAAQRFSVGAERIVLGGFSQGALTCLETVLAKQLRLAGLCLFSGSLLRRDQLALRAKSLAPMPCVISHGRSDPLLPFALADELQAELGRAGWDVDWLPFAGGHGISASTVQGAGRLLHRVLA